MKRRGNAEALIIIAALLSAALLLSCGAASDDRKAQGLSGTAMPAATVVGMKECTQCHWEMASQWLQTPHGNMNPNDPGDLNFTGNPATGAVIPGACKNCHDLDTDSANLIVNVTGNVARPVVGCEACHGGGSNHNGAGPIGVPYRLATSSSTPPTTGALTLNVNHPVNDFDTITRGGGDFTADGFAVGQVITTSGFTTAKNNGTFTIVGVAPLTITVNSTGMVTEAGGGDELIVAQSLTASSQFNTCNACHELVNMTTGVADTTPEHLGTTLPLGNQYYISDTHFARPGNFNCITTGATITGQSVNCDDINGYAMDYSSDQVCSTCHSLHADTMSINREWAASAHADMSALGTANGFFSGAWAHYNWTASASRRPCQRCHTTTVFAAYADALRSGNTALASAIDAGTSSFLAADANYKPEMLHCNGCHTDNRGTVRNPGAITANYGYVSSGVQYSIASFAYPDLANSNVCMACHTARESGDSLKNINTGQPGTSTFAFDNQSFINSHYLTGGGTVFAATGYEFSGRTYANANSFKHDKIGTAASSPPTGVNGPCVGCHMSRPGKNGNHLFLPIVRDQAFTPPVDAATQAGTGITGVASEVCITCHTDSGAGGLVERIWERKLEYFEALEALNAQLVTRDFNFVPASPYFFIDIAANYDPTYIESTAAIHCSENLPVKNWETGGTSNFNWNATDKRCDSSVAIAGTPGTGKLNMGAAFNFNLLEHEPGAYIHNSRYAKRLIYDSFDWLDDNEMNYSVGTTLDTLCGPPVGVPPVYLEPYCGGALAYLLNDTKRGVATERP